MSQLALLLDIGSTFTKALVCDLNAGRIVGRSQARTTARDDVMVGVRAALSHLGKFGLPTDPASRGYRARYATSSAAGGLRMVCIGLTRGLTARAAREAATGAGARIYGVFSGRLDREKIRKIADLAPDIVLFTGGINGGNEDHVLDNARLLATLPGRVPVVVGCNADVASLAAEVLSCAGLEVYLSRNVMPTLEGLDVAPAREIIRDVFMRHIVRAKGLGELSALLDIEVMPTPYAVMKGVDLLGETYDSMAVDVGGATTDVYSASRGYPTEGDLIPRGLADPRLRRTVEGDLGLREGVGSLLDLAQGRVLRGVRTAFPDFDRDALRTAARRREKERTYLADDPLEDKVDLELGKSCIDLATRRHAGVVEVEDTPRGQLRYLRGKDLRDVEVLVGTGGAFVGAARRGYSRKLLEAALFAKDESLRPVNPRLLVDPGYSVFAAGLLSFEHIEAS
ncbi:MAG: glutamate mutase L, partial [Bacillota bacterium]